MQKKVPKDTKILRWTKHVVKKMAYYGISEGLIRRVLRRPIRKQEGVAPDTISVMQPTGYVHTKEVWVMYQVKKGFTTIITAWRYPGKSPVHKIPIPDDIREELWGLTS